MTGRLALVIGSECNALRPLTFPRDLAYQLHDALRRGAWRATGDAGGPLIDPSFHDLKAAVVQAFNEANADMSALLIAFIGHGIATSNDDFYLMARDSPHEDPARRTDSDSALALVHVLREQLAASRHLDGLILLVDACQTGAAIEGAASRWTNVLMENRGRVEMLVASGGDNAYDGCFTRTILETFETGLPQRGDSLLCGDLQPEIGAKCASQAQHWAYNGTTPIRGDPGLWLVPNAARFSDVVHEHPAAGLLDQLTSGVILTAGVRENLARIVESGGHRLRLVVGPAGGGKTTTMALLVRPNVLDSPPVANDYIKAAVFLDRTSSLESLAEDLSLQLSANVPGFDEAVRSVQEDPQVASSQRLNRLDIAVLMPLRHCRPAGTRIHVIVDGLDQPDVGARELIVEALHRMTHGVPDTQLGHVRVIAGVRSGVGIDDREDLAHAYRIEIAGATAGDLMDEASALYGEHGEPPDSEDFAETIENLRGAWPILQDPAGGWLTVRLLREVAERVAGPLEVFGDLAQLVEARIEVGLRDRPAVADAVLQMIDAAGVGPTLPLELISVALGDGNETYPVSEIRNHLVDLGSLVTRGSPGRATETVGIAHDTLVEPITRYYRVSGDLEAAHRSLVSAYNRRLASPSSDVDSTVDAYWKSAAPQHFLGSGDASGAYELLAARNGVHAADNRDRWASWVPAFTAIVGRTNAHTMLARFQLARWHGEAGDVADAVAELQTLLDDLEPRLGADDPITMQVRRDLARWRGESGDLPTAIAEMEALLADYLRLLGPVHPDTMHCRNNLAAARMSSGDLRGAAVSFTALLADQLRSGGPDNAETLDTRNNLAWCRAALGDAGAVGEFITILEASVRVHGPEHRDTLSSRRNLAYWRARFDDCDGALAELEPLVPVVVNTLGEDDPFALKVRHDLASLRGDMGDPQRAIAELEIVLEDQLRVLGVDHPETLGCRCNIAANRGRSGDAAGAMRGFAAVFRAQRRVLGPTHPNTLETAKKLAALRNEQLLGGAGSGATDQ